jgi:hypothetical protein
MLVEKKLDPKDLRQSINSLNTLLIRLQCKYFHSAIHPSFSRNVFGRWALQTSLLQKVLSFLHFIEIPNQNIVESMLSILQYLGDPQRILSDIWIWIGEHERISHSHENLLEDLKSNDNFAFSRLPLSHLWILDSNYENIAHQTIHFNRIECLKYLSSLPNASQINQRNHEMNSPCHLALLQGKYELVSLLINSPNIDLTVQDLNQRTPLHLLLTLCLQQQRKKIQLPEKRISFLVTSMLSRDSSLFFLRDSQGYRPFEYSIMLGSVLIVATIFSHHLLPPITDFSPYLHQSIRFNHPALVNYFVNLYLNCDHLITLLNTSDISGSTLAEILCYCLEKNYLKSMLVLLSKKQFICAINSFTPSPSPSPSLSLFLSSLSTEDSSKRLPLHCAVDLMKFEGKMEPYRILDKFGVHVITYTSDTTKTPRLSRPLINPAAPDALSLIETLHTLHTSLVKIDHSKLDRHDNIFSYLCAIYPRYPCLDTHQFKTIERNSIDLLREIFCNRHPHLRSLKCYITHKSRKYQAAEIWNEESLGSDSFLKYFCNSFSFQCNPIVTVILSSQSISPSHPRSSSHQLEDRIFLGYHLLEYLLTHTPFIDLINAQEAWSQLTPLAAACVVGNRSFIELLCRHGARTDMKFNAHSLSTTPSPPPPLIFSQIQMMASVTHFPNN